MNFSPFPVYIAGAALHPFGKITMSLVEMLEQTSRKAIENAFLRSKDIDAIFIGAMNPEEFTNDGNLAVLVADKLNMFGIGAFRIETASSSGAGALKAAFFAIASGYYKNVLVVGGEKMSHLNTKEATHILAKVISKRERIYGASMPSLAALITKMYAKKYNITEDNLVKSLCNVAIKNHSRGALNPFAHFKKTITREEYFSAPFVSTPLRTFDCAPISDGAAALILSSQTNNSNIRLIGLGHATDTAEVSKRKDLSSFNSTKQAALQAYNMAKVTPSEIDFAEIHDAFTIFEIIGSEDLGFFEKGKGWEKTSKNKNSIIINPSGGLKSRGHPIGASGLAQIVEAYFILNNTVTPQQKLKKEMNTALTQSIGGMGNNNFVTILSKKDNFSNKNRKENKYNPKIHYKLSPQYPSQPPSKIKGRILASTSLYKTPKGFPSPLHLALIESNKEWRTLAYIINESSIRPFIETNETVKLELVNGFYLLKI